MSEETVADNIPPATGDQKTPAKGEKSLHKHLLNKVKQCSVNEAKYIEKLGNAKGKEVFKYLLLLNCIECESYVTEVQLQAQKIFNWSVGIAAAGFALVMASAAAAIASQMVSQKGLEIAYITGISGVLTTFISSIFLTLYYRSLKRMDEFHNQLREAQKIILSLFLSGLMQKGQKSSEAMQRMIDQLMSPIETQIKNNGHGNYKTKELSQFLEDQKDISQAIALAAQQPE
jgi:hypothetical protein